MSFKECKQCGELKPLELFRKYYGGRRGTYKVCLACEKINTREKYLARKADQMSEDEQVELTKIHALYDAQRAAGLQPPRTKLSASRVDNLDEMIKAYKSKAVLESVDAGADIPPVPSEIQKWLSAELTEEPDYYLDEVFEELTERYRPVLRIDQVTLQPIKDDTYKIALDALWDKFREYEDNYNWED